LLGAVGTETDTESRCQLPNSYKRFSPRLAHKYIHIHNTAPGTQIQAQNQAQTELGSKFQA